MRDRWFSRTGMRLPTIDGDEQGRLADLLHVILLAYAVLQGLLIVLAGILQPPLGVVRFVAVRLTVLGIASGLYLLLRRQHVVSVAFGVVILFWCGITREVWLHGVGTPAFLAYPVVVIVAGVLFGGWGSAVVTGVTALVGPVILFLGPVGSLPASAPYSAVHYWVANTIFCVIGSVLQQLNTRSLHTALLRTRQEGEVRARTEDALHRSEGNLQLALNAAFMGTWEWNLLENQIRWSDNVPSILGIDPTQFDGTIESYFRLVHPDDLEPLKERIQAVLEDRDSRDGFQHRIRTNEGELRWIEVLGSPDRDADGTAFQLRGVVMDITERRLADDALRESERFIQRVAEATPGILFIFDLTESRIVFCNPGLERLLGYSLPEIEAMGTDFILCLIHPDDIDRIRNLSERYNSAGDGEIVEFVYRVRHRNGEWRWLHNYDVIFARYPDGRPWQTLGVAQDVTLEREAEAALQESEARFRLLAENTSEIISRHTPDGVTLYASPACETILGYVPEEMVGRSPGEIVHPDDQEGLVEFVKQVLSHAAPSVHSIRAFCCDGREVWLELTARAIHDPETGDVVEIQCTSRDITERHNLQEQLLQSQKMDSIGRLAGGIAHDFNNLLTAIIGYADVARLALPAGSPASQSIEQIGKASERAAGLTAQLLAFARKQVVAPQPLNLNAVIRETEDMLRRFVGENVEIGIVLDNALGTVKADPAQMHQVLMNLVVNARDAMPDGGRLSITTSNVYEREAPAGVTPGDYVSLAVRDTGIGIASDDIPRIFEPFFTTKRASRGTGLGLATCHGIVKQQNGYITVSSEPGNGATFRVFLPRVNEAPVTAPPASRPGHANGTEIVLLAEDEKAVRTLAVQGLEGYGYRVLAAVDGLHALELIRRYHAEIDILVTDVVMPGVNGPIVAEAFRRCRPQAPVLFISGYPDSPERMSREVETGGAFLPKPFTLQQLAERVRQLLDRSVSTV